MNSARSEREGEDGREVDAADGRDDATEGVEVRVADVEERLECSHTARLGEPAEQHCANEQVLVHVNEVAKSPNEDIFNDAVTRNSNSAHLAPPILS
eukprot:CAMPEP_0173128718 /NCGR_PEP_ID=MMETSP1102-20130122/58717_1 /TAXON_ID=49646 /ORGANISM="Geminigera sp., Strain Caron Lab Isolate" /LENGTH=96 /DNA_ID=CAMNT_0014038907 /DNA_START=579 /DNA_END=870 /DNA_ORIENTATION=+